MNQPDKTLQRQIKEKTKEYIDKYCKSKMYYCQNGFSGNSAMWWKKNNAGYTSNLNEAAKFSEDEKFCREEDVKWPCDFVDSIANSSVDCQNLNKEAFDQFIVGDTDLGPTQPDEVKKKTLLIEVEHSFEGGPQKVLFGILENETDDFLVINDYQKKVNHQIWKHSIVKERRFVEEK